MIRNRRVLLLMVLPVMSSFVQAGPSMTDKELTAASAEETGNGRGFGLKEVVVQTSADLEEHCEASAARDGTGSALIEGQLVVEDQNLSISVPCRVTLAPESELRLVRVQLVAQHLVIGDDSSNGKTSVRISDSHITGRADSGLLIHLKDAVDRVIVERSTVDFPRSIWIRIFGEGESSLGGGSIRISHTTLRSIDKRTDGIILSASESGGDALFENLELETQEDAPLVLFAGTCHANNIVGAPEDCGPL